MNPLFEKIVNSDRPSLICSGRILSVFQSDVIQRFVAFSLPVIVVLVVLALVVTGCGDGVARCFDAKSGALKRTLKGHTVAINAFQVNTQTSVP